MDAIFEDYLPLIKSLLKDDDLYKFLREPLSVHFERHIQLKIVNNLDHFFEEFKKVKDDKKYDDFVEVTKDISEWISLFLGASDESQEYRKQFNLIFDMIHLQSEEAVNSFPMTEPFLLECHNEGLITLQVKDELIAKLKYKGANTVKYKFLWEIHKKSKDCYGLLLKLLYRKKTDYIVKFCDDLYKSLEGVTEREAEDYIMAYAESIIDKNMNVSIKEEKIKKSDEIEVDDRPGIECRPPMEGYTGISDNDMNVIDKDTKVSFKEDKTNKCDNTEFDGCPDLKNEHTLRTCTTFMENIAGLNKDTDRFTVGEMKSNDRDSLVDSMVQDVMAGSTESERHLRTFKKAEDDVVLDGDSSDDENDTEDDSNEVNCDNLFGALKSKSLEEILNFDIDDNKSKGDERKELNVRGYQQELAKQGIAGYNVLICSPTGSGKTIVAVKIVEEHLRKVPGAKVAFIVHRIALVEQQYAQFSKYLKCKITRLSGSMKSACAPLVGHIPCFDVFVMTSDILRNALEQENETKLESLSIFTMILFDECHNCDKKHPYNRIMHHYFKIKEEKQCVPQIVGLTASTGTNKANTMTIAMKRLFTLCANLDTYIVSTVKESVEELLKNQSRPKEDVIPAEPRQIDNFEIEMQNQMQVCENFLHEMNARDFFPKDSATKLIFSIPEDRMHQKYSGFVGKLNNLLNVTKRDHQGRESIYAIAQYLNVFVRALMVNHLFRAQDAIKTIKDLLNFDSTSTPTCKVESILRKNLKKFDKASLMQTNNPCLKILQEKIEEQLKEENSRIIVFVRERVYTQILKDVFTSLNDSKIRCDTIVGNTISAEKGGLTQNEMEEVLGRFRSGECNVLFSTTVAEEGLDVQQCNLVIRYGHVTNETAMVQSRGRARAKGSKYYVIVPHKLQWQINKENINKYRESMMYRAIEKFQSLDKREREEQIDECQYERLLLETMENTKKLSLGNGQRAQLDRTLFCKKCNTEICKSSDIRLVENAHHLVINTMVFDNMIINPKNNNQIICKKCFNQLGNKQNYKSRIFPNLTISAFSVVCEGETLSRSFKKWKEVDFDVRPGAIRELLNFKPDHSLSM